MNTPIHSFRGGPHTRVGWLAVGLGALFTVLFVGIVNEVIRFSGFLTMMLGLAAGILTLIALIVKKERSWLLWLMLIPGVFAILFTMGEILYPH